MNVGEKNVCSVPFPAPPLPLLVLPRLLRRLPPKRQLNVRDSGRQGNKNDGFPKWKASIKALHFFKKKVGA